MRSRAAVIAVVAILAGLPLAVGGAAPAAAAGPVRNGSTEALAAPSCWAIKQANPAAADGPYWLQTPLLVAPQRFYCDMTTDGGGWVLVGRGRNGWSWDHTGQGTANAIATTPAGTGAFAPAALPAATIDGLLNGAAVADLPDGVRIRRAANAAGTAWQDVRWDFMRLQRWSWALGGGMRLDSTRIDGTTYAGGNTRDSQVRIQNQPTNPLIGRNDNLRLFTFGWQRHGWQAGFAYGGTVSGANNTTSYLWQLTDERHAIPFAQVWIRPRVTEADVAYAPLPDAGVPATGIRPLLQNTTEGGTTPWGVTGVVTTDGSAVPNVEVVSFAQVGNTVFVGGKFQYVQQGAAGTRTEQRHLAAFDATTGAWISSFRPVLDGTVWDMEATPDGRLVVGGQFTTVNGVPASGLVALDPATGATVAGWRAAVIREGTTERPAVRSMDLSGDWIYIGGNFNRITGGTATTPIQVGNAARIRWATGQPDPQWKPNFPAAPLDVSVDDAGERAYFVGHSTTVNGVAADGVAVVTTAIPPQVVPWTWTPSATTDYQQTVLATGGRVYQGGAEHNLDLYETTGGANGGNRLVQRHITRAGGDFQGLAMTGGVLYASCHCPEWNYAGAMTYTTVPDAPRVDEISYIGAYDPVTLEQLPDFLPRMSTRRGEGPWELFVAANGCLWAGGDLNGGSGGAWAGGFARYCPRDSVVPATPTNLASTLAGDDVTLRWAASTDDRAGAVRYEVLRDDRVIATVAGTSFTDPDRTSVSRYAVRAVDAAGNRSATTPVRSVTPPPPAVGTLAAAGGTWSYLAGGAAAPAGWNTVSFDHAAWATGAAPLGWAEVDTRTTIPSSGVTSYFVRRFEVTDPAAIASLLVRLRRDDGAVVYVNGVEVARSSMPAGPVSSTTPAAWTSGADETRWFELAAPAYPLVAGTNVVAVELHQGEANNADATMDLELIARGGTGDTVAPTAPAVTAARTGAGSARLTWTASTDDGEVLGYRVRRDGADLGFVAATATTFDDAGLAAATSYAYEITAIDLSGNASAPGTATYATDPDANLITAASSWKWRYDAAAPQATWNQPAFDDAAWASGRSEFGYGEGDEVTVLTTAAAPRPITAHFRTTFTIGDPARIAGIDVDVVRDDGVVVYVNGVELGRDNMPAGAITATTPASAQIVDRGPETTPVRFVVPPSALVAGVNTIAVEVHQSDAWSGDMSMSLRAVARFV